MEQGVYIHNLGNISKQRNLFLFICLALLLSNILLSMKVVFRNEKVIMVPNLQREIWTTNSQVSSSYLEEITHVFLNNLLDINSQNIPYKKSLILNNLREENPGDVGSVHKYFASAIDKYKKFDLSTYFTVKNMKIDADKLEVTAMGILSSSYGKGGFENSDESYKVRYQYSNGKIYLKSFKRIIKQ